MKINEVIDHTKLKNGQEEWMVSSKITSLINFMKKNCSNIIKIYKDEGYFLYRGIRHQASSILLGRSRDDRKPMDTPPDIQNKLDKVLASQGFTALRGNSIFCSSSFAFVHDYGTPFMIFPVNGFTYTWNTDAQDLYKRWLLRSEYSILANELKVGIDNPEQFIKEFHFINNERLDDALTTGREIYINGSCVAIDCESNSFGIIMAMLDLGCPDWSDYYGCGEYEN